MPYKSRPLIRRSSLLSQWYEISKTSSSWHSTFTLIKIVSLNSVVNTKKNVYTTEFNVNDDHSSSLTLNVTRTQPKKDNVLFTALRQSWMVPRYQTTSGYMAVLFISIGRMLYLALTPENADPLFVLVITPGSRFTKRYNKFYLKIIVTFF